MELHFGDRMSLVKPGVSALSGAAALLGYAAYGPAAGPALAAGGSVLLLSAGACALNNYQDRYYDARRERTRLRPLPAGRLTGRQALAQAALLLGAGFAGLFLSSASAGGPLAGLLAVLLYNAAYTPLKKRTLWALVPGLLCGVLPPLAGWAAAGGAPGAPRIVYLMALFGVWQLPHLWLLALANSRDELRGRAPSFLDTLPAPLLQRLVLTWAAAFAFLTLFLKVFGFINNWLPVLLLAANAVALPLVFAAVLYGARGAAGFRGLFRYLNVSLLGATLLAAAEALGR